MEEKFTDKKNYLTIILAFLIVLVSVFLLIFMRSEKNLAMNIDTGSAAIIDDKYLCIQEDEDILAFYDRNGNIYKKIDKVKSYVYHNGYIYALSNKKIYKLDYRADVLGDIELEEDIEYLLANEHILIGVGAEKSYFLKNLEVVGSFDNAEEKPLLTKSYGDDYAIASLGLRDGRIFSKLYMYDDKSLYYKNIFIDRPILYLASQEKKLISAGKDYILKFDKASPDYKNEYGGLKSIGTDDEYTYIITYDDDLFILDKELKMVYNEKLDGEYIVYSNKSGSILYNENGYMVFDKDKLVKTSASGLKYIAGLYDFYLVYENKIERMR